MSFWFLCLAYTQKTTRSGLWDPGLVMTLQMNLTSMLKFDVNVKSRPPVGDTVMSKRPLPVYRNTAVMSFCTSGPRTSRQIPHQHACMRQCERPEPAFFCILKARYHMWISALHGPWTFVLWLRGAQHTIWHFTKFISYLSDTDYHQNLIRPTCKITLITQCGGALRDWNTPGARKTVDSGVWDLSRVTGTL